MSVVSAVTAGTLVASAYGIAGAEEGPGHAPGFPPRVVEGQVTAVTATGFTVMGRDGNTVTVATTSATKYFEPGSPMPVTGVAVGERVIVFLTRPAMPTTTTTPSSTTTTPSSTATTPSSTTTTASSTTTTPSSTTTASSSSTTAGSTPAAVTADRVPDGDADDVPSSSTTTPTTTTPTAAFVDILLQRESGFVTAVSGSTITLSGFWERTRTIDVTASTAYFERGKAVTASAVQPGDFVVAFGDPPPSGTFTASVVDVTPLPAPKPATPPVHPTAQRGDRDGGGAARLTRSGPHQPATRGREGEHPRPTTTTTTSPTTAPTTTPPTTTAPAAVPASVFGTVVSVSGTSITVDPNGGTKTITVTSATTYFANGAPASEAAVAPGDRILARGTVDPRTGTFTATSVDVLGQTQPPAQPRPQGETPRFAPAPRPAQPSPRPAPVESGGPSSSQGGTASGGSGWSQPTSGGSFGGSGSRTGGGSGGFSGGHR